MHTPHEFSNTWQHFLLSVVFSLQISHLNRFSSANPSCIIVYSLNSRSFSSFLLFVKVNMGPVALCIVALVVISITHWVYRWRNPRCSGELPPGSMGLPLLGETLEFFAPNASSDIPPFIKKRTDRY